MKGSLHKDLIDLVYLRVSQINGCAFCIDMHTRDLLKSGQSVEKLALLEVWHDAGKVFTARERVALEWAESVTSVASTAFPDEVYEAAASEFTDNAELTYAIGLMNALYRFGVAFRSTPAAAAAAAAKAGVQRHLRLERR